MDDLTLYDISSELISLTEKIQDQGGEIVEKDGEILEALEKALKEKTDGIVAFVRKEEDFLNAVDERIKDLQALKSRRLADLEKFNGYVIRCMTAMGEKEISGEIDKIMLPKPTDVVDIQDETKLPLEYIHTEKKIVTRPDKKAIKEALKKGAEVPGVALTPGKQSVRYKAGGAKIKKRKAKG